MCVAQEEVSLDIQLYDLVAATPLGEFINSEIFTSNPEECLDLYQFYINDFINSVYRTTRDDEIDIKVKVTNCPVLVILFNYLAGLPST